MGGSRRTTDVLELAAAVEREEKIVGNELVSNLLVSKRAYECQLEPDGFRLDEGQHHPRGVHHVSTAVGVCRREGGREYCAHREGYISATKSAAHKTCHMHH